MRLGRRPAPRPLDRVTDARLSAVRTPVNPRSPLGRKLLAFVATPTSRLVSRCAIRIPHPPLERLLDRAGNPRGWTADRLAASLVMAAFAGALAGWWSGDLTGGPLRGLCVAVVGGSAAAAAPIVQLRSRGSQRASAIGHQFPDTLDLLAVTVAAGLAFDAALARVTSTDSGPLSDELGRLQGDLALGTSRSTALRSFADRVGVAALADFATAVSHADAVGSPLAETLRVQAETQRVNYALLVEERAQQLPVKLVVPLVLCILPALFVVVIGPAVVSILSAGVLP